MVPGELRDLRTVFDEVWASLAEDHGVTIAEVQAVRDRLAVLLFDLSEELEGLELAQTVARLMRQELESPLTSPDL